MKDAPEDGPEAAMNSAPQPADLLIHVGLEKTGTTWLQRNLFEARRGIELEYEGDLGTIYDALVVPAERDFSPEAARAAFAPLIDAARRSGRLAVISAEALAGRPFHAKHFREANLRRLAAAFPEARILATIREQTAIIGSMYGQYVRYGHTSSLREALAVPPEGSGFHPVMDLGFYDYLGLRADLLRSFPEPQVMILPFEALSRDPAAALTRLSAWTGRPLDAVDPQAAETPRNPAWSDLAYFAMRQANRLVSQDSRWKVRGKWWSPNAVGHRVDRLTPGFLRRSMRDRARRTVEERVGGMYARSNAELSEAIGFDLGALGYRV